MDTRATQLCAQCLQPSNTKCIQCELPYCSDSCLDAAHSHPMFQCVPDDHRHATAVSISDKSEVIIEREDVQIAIRELIGAGAFGKVYAACFGNNCKTVVKLQGLSTKEDSPLPLVRHFQREAYITNVASDKQFGPKLFFSEVFWRIAIPRKETKTPKFNMWLRDLDDRADRIGVIVQERWSGSLDNWKPEFWQKNDDIRANNNLNTLQRMIMYKTATMWSYGFVHADLLRKNVLIKIDAKQNITNATLADFGLSFSIASVRRDKIETLVTYLSDRRHPEHIAFQAPRLKDNFTVAKIIAFPPLLDYVFTDFLMSIGLKKG